MSPIEQAKRLYHKNGMCLEDDLARYIKDGYFFATPEAMMMGRPCYSGEPDKWLSDNTKADTWYVHFAAGKNAVQWSMKMMPWFLPKLCWRRDFKNEKLGMRYFNTKRVLSLSGAE